MTDHCLARDPEYGVTCLLPRGHMFDHAGIKQAPNILYSWPCNAADELCVGITLAKTLIFITLITLGAILFVIAVRLI